MSDDFAPLTFRLGIKNDSEGFLGYVRVPNFSLKSNLVRVTRHHISISVDWSQ